jgi:hypothetical protein
MSKVALSENPLVVDEITLDGKRVQVQSVDLPLDDVMLDPNNPRIANTVSISLSEKGEELQQRLEALLWDDTDVRDLYRQVLINQGLVERIIVRQDGRVVEGNCRTVVYRKLRERHSGEERWRTIPARLLPADIADRDVAILLGEMHVAGKNTWTPFEKAGHVYRMHNDFALVQDEIAVRLRMSKSKVNQLIRAFDMMKNKYLPKYPGPASSRKFSYSRSLHCAIGYSRHQTQRTHLSTGSVQANWSKAYRYESCPQSSRTRMRCMHSQPKGSPQLNEYWARITR